MEKGNFRYYANHFVAIEMTEELRSRMTGYEGIRTANYAWAYGYIDPEKGLCFEILSACRQHSTDHKFTDKKPNNDNQITLTAKEVENLEIAYFEFKRKNKQREKYAYKLALLEKYQVSDEVEESRTFDFLDDCRDQYHPDIVKVTLVSNDGYDEMFVRITGLNEHSIRSVILTEPHYRWGLRTGEEFNFNIEYIEDEDRHICVKSFDEEDLIYPADLADGTILAAAAKDFTNDRSHENFARVADILIDSSVWVPCVTIIGESTTKRLEEILRDCGMDMDDFTNLSLEEKKELFEQYDFEIPEDDVIHKVELLENDGEYFYPIYSNGEAMVHYNDNSVYLIQMRMLEAINNAQEEDEFTISGMVLDAFTSPFIIVLDLMDEMKDAIEEQIEEAQSE